MSYTVNGIECSTMAEAIALKAAMMSQAPKAAPTPPAPKRPRARSFSSVNNKGLQAGVSYDFALSLRGNAPGTWVRDLLSHWNAQGLRTTRPVYAAIYRNGRKTKATKLVSEAGSTYSLNSVLPWAHNAVDAIASGMSRDQFIAAATAKGSKVGQMHWKP